VRAWDSWRGTRRGRPSFTLRGLESFDLAAG
jgi:hypothetical protein